MRSEFLGVCARFKGLAEAVNRTQYLLPQMERPALVRAIREPAMLYDGEVSRELAERLIADAGGDQDQLPLIQHGLMLLWRARRVRLRRDVGCRSAEPFEVRGAAPFPRSARSGLALGRGLSECRRPRRSAVRPCRHGDGAGRPDSERQKIVEHLFRALTDINAEGSAVRRPQTLAELVAVTGSDEPTLQTIVDPFRADGVSFLTLWRCEPIGPDR